MFQFTEPCDTPVYVDEVEGGVPEGVWRIGRPSHEGDDEESGQPQAWLPDGNSQIFRTYVFGPSGFWTMAPLRYAAKFDPFLSLDCAGLEGGGKPNFAA